MLKIDKTRLLGYRQGVSASSVPMVGAKPIMTKISQYSNLFARKGTMMGVKVGAKT